MGTVKGSVATPLHFFELWEDDAGIKQVRDGTVSHSELDDWLNFPGQYVAGRGKTGKMFQPMRLRLISAGTVHRPDSLSCGYDTFGKIRRFFKLDDTSEEALVNKNGAFIRSITTNRGSSDRDRFRLVYKVPNSSNIGYDFLSLCFNRTTKASRAFIHGIRTDEHQRLFQSLQAQRSNAFNTHPLLLPTQLIRSHLARTEAYKESVQADILSIELQMGKSIPGLLQRKPLSFVSSMANVEKLDFENTVRRLHAYQTELFHLIHGASFSKSLGDFLVKTAEELKQLQFVPDGEDAWTHDMVVHRLEFCTNQYMTLVAHCSVLKERVQSHITLIFGLIAQDENRISRSVAEESAMIAVASKRDSAAMKTIAVLTIVFLPPTFVATFFSMTLFNWTPQTPGDRITSKYFWVYWVVAIPLTALVLIIWRLWWTMEEKRYRHDLRKAREERVTAISHSFSAAKRD